MTPSLITLTTDFGLDDCYVGVIKGVIATLAPETKIIDLCHAVAAQDILQASQLVYANFTYFPRGTLHLVIVDPGVGSERRIILAETNCGHFFLAPDNGVLSPFLHNGQISRAFWANREDLHLRPVSATFHGRDIFAPLAAHLSAGNPPESLGPQCALDALVIRNSPEARFLPGGEMIEGAIVHIDHFGNLTTNITEKELAALAAPADTLRLTLNNHHIQGLLQSYSAAPPGAPLLLLDSANHLEIAVNQGNAHTIFSASLYDPVNISVRISDS